MRLIRRCQICAVRVAPRRGWGADAAARGKGRWGVSAELSRPVIEELRAHGLKEAVLAGRGMEGAARQQRAHLVAADGAGAAHRALDASGGHSTGPPGAIGQSRAPEFVTRGRVSCLAVQQVCAHAVREHEGAQVVMTDSILTSSGALGRESARADPVHDSLCGDQAETCGASCGECASIRAAVSACAAGLPLRRILRTPYRSFRPFGGCWRHGRG